MEKIDRQAIFDTIYKRWTKNPVRAYLAGSCYYRLPVTNQPCFIGMLIPDHLYVAKMEGQSAHNALLMAFPLLTFNPGDPKFLRALQSCHDEYTTVEEVTEALHDLAKDYNLTIKEFDE